MKFALIGAGRVGTSLASSLKELGGWEFRGYYSSSYPESIPEKEKIESPDEFEIGDIVIMALPDSSINKVSRELPPSLMVGHTGGSLDHRAIESPEPQARFSIHPLHPVKRNHTDLSGIKWGIEGDRKGVEIASEIVDALKGKFFEISTDMKPVYHFSAMLSTNLIQSLIYLGDLLFRKCGVDDSITLELVEKTLENIKEDGPVESLTGPVERGDYIILERNLKKMSNFDSSRVNLLCELLMLNLEVAKKKGLKERDANRITDIIADYSGH